MAVAEQLVEITTRHAVFLERLKSGEANQFADFLKRIDEDLRRRLMAVDITELSRTRMERLVRDIERQLRAIYGEHWDELRGNLIDTAVYEAEFERRALARVVTAGTVLPDVDQIRAAVLTRPLSVRGPEGGKLLESFVKDWSAVEVKRVSGAVRQGYFEGQTTQQIVRNIRGTKANGYRDGLLSITSRNAHTIVRTAVQHAAMQARQSVWERNPDVVSGVEWVSTLDGRTSAPCRSLDGQQFPIDKGPRPPLHPNCRSSVVPVLNDGLDFLDKDATRASKDGPVDASETYYSWLKRQPAAFQNEAIGPTRAKLLRSGGLTAERFAELNLGRNFKPLTLDQMRDLEPLAFEKAGL